MRRFNPDKELYKIQHGNKNKIIVGVVALLIILGISSSYALYQVRYSKRIIYTKVVPFSTSDLDLAIYVDGKPGKLPSKGTAFLNSVECDNDNNLSIFWDYDKWSMNIPNIEVPNKCTIYFSKENKLNSYLKYNNELMDDKTIDHNLRYIGKNPNNYIWFNCDSYDNLTQETAAEKCEKWRIIGLMNNMTIVDEPSNSETTNQSLVKIIRAESIGDIAWNSAGTNNWATASLQTSLNTTYYNGTNLGSGKGITGDTRTMIENVKWNIGGVPSTSFTAVEYYEKEREDIVPSGAQTIWPGKIALMYSSDYGLATGFDACSTINLGDYTSECSSNNWLFVYSWEYTLTAESSSTTRAYRINGGGYIYLDGCKTSQANPQRPSLYLKSNIKIVSGDGSSTPNGTNGPYILSV